MAIWVSRNDVAGNGGEDEAVADAGAALLYLTPEDPGHRPVAVISVLLRLEERAQLRPVTCPQRRAEAPAAALW